MREGAAPGRWLAVSGTTSAAGGGRGGRGGVGGGTEARGGGSGALVAGFGDHFDGGVVDDFAHEVEEGGHVLVGEGADVEGGGGFGRDHVDLEPGLEDVGRNRSVEHGVSAGIVFGEVLADGGGFGGVEEALIARGLFGGTDGCELLEIVAGGVVEAHGRVPHGDLLDGAGQVENGIGAHGSRAVAGGAVGDEACAAGLLLGGLDDGVVHLTVLAPDAAALDRKRGV